MKSVETPQGRCHAGIASCDITPPVGIYHRMWGAASHDRSTGVHRPLVATVLWIESHTGDAPLVIVGIDHCLFWAPEMNRMLDEVSHAASVPRDSLIFFFSHTHGAGLMGRERYELPGGDLIEPYLNETAVKIGRLVNEARESKIPATIVYGHGHCDLAHHRNFFDEERGGFVCGLNPGGPTDSTVMIGRVTNDHGSVIATIVNYACHPTTLAWDNTLISPDYIGAMREVIEVATKAPCLFIQGASGDIGPKDGFVGDVEVADRNGRQLGYAVLSALEGLPRADHRFDYAGAVVSGATIGTWKHVPESNDEARQHAIWNVKSVTIPLKYRSDLPKRSELELERSHWQREEEQAIASNDGERSKHARAMLERVTRRFTRVESLVEGDSYPYEILAWRIGDAIWIAYEGELDNIVQRSVRERFPDVPIFVGTLANGSKVWYLIEQKNFGKGLYQEEVSVLAPGCIESVIEASTGLVRELLA